MRHFFIGLFGLVFSITTAHGQDKNAVGPQQTLDSQTCTSLQMEKSNRAVSEWKINDTCKQITKRIIKLNDLNPFVHLKFEEIKGKNKYFYYNPDPWYSLSGNKTYDIWGISYSDLKPILADSFSLFPKKYKFTIAGTYRNQKISHNNAWINNTFYVNAIPPDDSIQRQISLSSSITIYNLSGEIVYKEFNQNYGIGTVLITDSILCYNYSQHINDHLLCGSKIISLNKHETLFESLDNITSDGVYNDWIKYNHYYVRPLSINNRISEVTIFDSKNSSKWIFKPTRNFSELIIYEDHLQLVNDSFQDNTSEFENIELK